MTWRLKREISCSRGSSSRVLLLFVLLILRVKRRLLGSSFGPFPAGFDSCLALDRLLSIEMAGPGFFPDRFDGLRLDRLDRSIRFNRFMLVLLGSSAGCLGYLGGSGGVWGMTVRCPGASMDRWDRFGSIHHSIRSNVDIAVCLAALRTSGAANAD